jgi:hypothetical protein
MLNELRAIGKQPLKMLYRCNRDNGSRIFSLTCWLKGEALSKFQPVWIIDHVMSAELLFSPVAYFIVYWGTWLQNGRWNFCLWCLRVMIKHALALLCQQKEVLRLEYKAGSNTSLWSWQHSNKKNKKTAWTLTLWRRRYLNVILLCGRRVFKHSSKMSNFHYNCCRSKENWNFKAKNLPYIQKIT